MSELLRRAAELDERGEPYILATVVAVDRPVSARPGDRAIISATGELEGWVGGSCSEPIVVREALASLADGTAKLVRIRPPGAPREPDRVGVVNEITTCASEGGLDVFIEPQLPRPRLVLVGSSPVTRTLAKIAEIFDYRVTAVLDDPAEKIPGTGAPIALDVMDKLTLGARDAAIVATMNRYDEISLETALKTGAGYVGLVASSARRATVIASLKARGADDAALEAVRSPAGFDLGPSTQAEIALAIMAEVIAARHQIDPGEFEVDHPTEQTQHAIDPVCEMTVAIVPGAITAEHEGVPYYFCAPGCRRAFLENPDNFLQAVEET
ncbi:MAG: YHS domain-containing protein [Gemmatimonas sp.]|nr:YHS domain-containing protein [Gemmatimonas sp.]